MLCYYGLLLLPNSSMANGCRQGFTRRSPPLVSSDRFLCLLRRNAGSVRMKRPRSSMLACSLSNVPSLDTSSITHHGLHPSPFSTATNDGGENPKEEDVVAAGKIRNMTAETQALAADLLSSVDHPDQEDIISSHDTSSLSSSLWKHRAALSKAITLIESRAPEKQVQASLLLTHLMRHANHGEKRQHSSFRIGM